MNSRGKEVPHGVRLYSIASSRYGDYMDGNTTSLCVRRATYWDDELKADDPGKARKHGGQPTNLSAQSLAWPQMYNTGRH